MTDIDPHSLGLRALFEWLSLTLFLASSIGYEWYHVGRTHRDPASTRHGRLLARQVEWVSALVARDEPLIFIQALRNLQQLSTFLGSLTLLSLGGAFGLLLSGERLRTLCEITFLFGHPSLPLAQLKLLFLVAVLAISFLNFVWALRALRAALLFTDGNVAEREARAAGLTRYLAHFQLDFRHGLRTAYFAVCLLIWPFSVELFVVVTLLLTVGVARYDLQPEAG